LTFSLNNDILAKLSQKTTVIEQIIGINISAGKGKAYLRKGKKFLTTATIFDKMSNVADEIR
jgi:hypothetical protein